MKKTIAALAIIALLLLSSMVAADKAVLKSKSQFNDGWQKQIKTYSNSTYLGVERIDSNGIPRGKCVAGVNHYTGLPFYGAWARYSDGTYKCILLKSYCQRFPNRC